MAPPKKPEEIRENHKHDNALLFTCFLLSALIGYVLTHCIALFGA